MTLETPGGVPVTKRYQVCARIARTRSYTYRRGEAGDHRGLRLWPGFPIFRHVLMVAVHFRNPLRGCAGFRSFDCRNRYARGVDDLRCRPGHNN